MAACSSGSLAGPRTLRDKSLPLGSAEQWLQEDGVKPCQFLFSVLLSLEARDTSTAVEVRGRVMKSHAK